MDALVASYGDDSSDSEADSNDLPPPPVSVKGPSSTQSLTPLPPPPLALLDPPNSIGNFSSLLINAFTVFIIPCCSTSMFCFPEVH